MHMPLNRMRLKRKLRNELMSRGVEGYPHSDLIMKCRTHIFKGSDIIEILEDWRSRDLVQKFHVKTKTSKKPVIYWRATTFIIDGRL